MSLNFFTPRTPSKQENFTIEISTITAVEIGLEYASLRAASNCPGGMYLTPSPDTLLIWHGVYFVHSGPYIDSVLRFTLIFPSTYPQQTPVIRFDSDMFHPMVDPKTKIWHAQGRLARWRPRLDHVPQLLQALRDSFETRFLQDLKEDEAINKHIWSLYHHSPQTFLSMTHQRAQASISKSTLYPSSRNNAASGAATIPTSTVPITPPRIRTTSGLSVSSVHSVEESEKAISFRELTDLDREILWNGLKRSIGA